MRGRKAGQSQQSGAWVWPADERRRPCNLPAMSSFSGLSVAPPSSASVKPGAPAARVWGRRVRWLAQPPATAYGCLGRTKLIHHVVAHGGGHSPECCTLGRHALLRCHSGGCLCAGRWRVRSPRGSGAELRAAVARSGDRDAGEVGGCEEAAAGGWEAQMRPRERYSYWRSQGRPCTARPSTHHPQPWRQQTSMAR